MQTPQVIIAALVATCLAQGAQADQLTHCTHPALERTSTCVAPAGIDANTFIVQPPASTRWLAQGGRANADHPAVAVARMQRQAVVDANTFIVQPPVAVVWTVMERDAMLAQLRTATTN